MNLTSSKINHWDTAQRKRSQAKIIMLTGAGIMLGGLLLAQYIDGYGVLLGALVTGYGKIKHWVNQD